MSAKRIFEAIPQNFPIMSLNFAKKIRKKSISPSTPPRQQTGFLDPASTKKHAESVSADSKLRILSTYDVHPPTVRRAPLSVTVTSFHLPMFETRLCRY